MPAENNYVAVLFRKSLSGSLAKGFALGRHIYGVGLIVKVLGQALICLEYGLRLHNHALTAAVWVVVHTAVLVKGKVTYLNIVELKQALFLGSADYALVQHRLKHFGKQSEYIKSHQSISPFISSTLM